MEERNNKPNKEPITNEGNKKSFLQGALEKFAMAIGVLGVFAVNDSLESKKKNEKPAPIVQPADQHKDVLSNGPRTHSRDELEKDVGQP